MYFIFRNFFENNVFEKHDLLITEYLSNLIVINKDLKKKSHFFTNKAICYTDYSIPFMLKLFKWNHYSAFNNHSTHLPSKKKIFLTVLLVSRLFSLLLNSSKGYSKLEVVFKLFRKTYQFLKICNCNRN